MSDRLNEQLTLGAEFLRRALGHGREGDPADVAVTPGALPLDFPLTLPEWVGLRVWGGVRAAATGWTFDYSGPSRLTERPPRTDWRAFLDVPAPQPEAMAALLDHFGAQGWQTAQVFQDVFVEADRSQWLGARSEPPRTLTVFSRQQGDATQVWLTVADVDPRQVEHLLGRSRHPGFHDHFEAPLPTLTLPDGWKAQMRSGQGDPVRSQNAVLLPSADRVPDAAALLTHFLPQLERQGWRLLHQEDGPEPLSVYRTPLGVGSLFLRAGGDDVTALIVHATAGEGGGSVRTSFRIP